MNENRPIPQASEPPDPMFDANELEFRNKWINRLTAFGMSALIAGTSLIFLGACIWVFRTMTGL